MEWKTGYKVAYKVGDDKVEYTSMLETVCILFRNLHCHTSACSCRECLEREIINRSLPALMDCGFSIGSLVVPDRGFGPLAVFDKLIHAKFFRDFWLKTNDTYLRNLLPLSILRVRYAPSEHHFYCKVTRRQGKTVTAMKRENLSTGKAFAAALVAQKEISRDDIMEAYYDW